MGIEIDLYFTVVIVVFHVYYRMTMTNEYLLSPLTSTSVFLLALDGRTPFEGVNATSSHGIDPVAQATGGRRHIREAS